MPDVDLMKWLLSNAPSLVIAVGVAKIYYKVLKFAEKIEHQVSQNSEDIALIIKTHTKLHKDDLPKFYRRKNSDNG